MMARVEMLLRHGYYAGLASRLLGDDSYGKRWLGRADQLTFEEYLSAAHEIQERLVAAGHITADEDPFESML